MSLLQADFGLPSAPSSLSPANPNLYLFQREQLCMPDRHRSGEPLGEEFARSHFQFFLGLRTLGLRTMMSKSQSLAKNEFGRSPIVGYRQYEMFADPMPRPVADSLRLLWFAISARANLVKLLPTNFFPARIPGSAPETWHQCQRVVRASL